MTEEQPLVPNKALVTPRAAAIAGIIFAVLMGLSYGLITANLPTNEIPAHDSFLEQEGTLTLALSLVPFAGIAFLWFMGVLRDRLGQLEDQFFSTLFMGSGILYLAMTFAAAAISGGLLAIGSINPEYYQDDAIYLLSRYSVFQFNRVFAMRMAGMHMLVAGTIWMRTGVVHRWLVVTTYILALLLIFGLGLFSWFTMVFPTWVFVISVYILIWNYRQPNSAMEE